jgi:hypothetical protein
MYCNNNTAHFIPQRFCLIILNWGIEEDIYDFVTGEFWFGEKDVLFLCGILGFLFLGGV